MTALLLPSRKLYEARSKGRSGFDHSADHGDRQTNTSSLIAYHIVSRFFACASFDANAPLAHFNWRGSLQYSAVRRIPYIIGFQIGNSPPLDIQETPSAVQPGLQSVRADRPPVWVKNTVIFTHICMYRPEMFEWHGLSRRDWVPCDGRIPVFPRDGKHGVHVHPHLALLSPLPPSLPPYRLSLITLWTASVLGIADHTR